MNFNKSLMAFAITLVSPWAVMAGPISYNFTSGTRAATVDFARSGTDLIVTLTNTSTFDAMNPTDILTAVFFDVVGNPTLSRTSAIIAPGSFAFTPGTGATVTPVGGVVGGEWAYKNSLAYMLNNQAVSSVGLNIFGPGDLFPGPDLTPPPSPDGVEWGITSIGDNPTTGNGGLIGNNPQDLIKNAVVFTLGGYTGEPSTDILRATFQYGTALDEFSITVPTPEPGSCVLLGLGGIGFAALVARRRMRQTKSG
jgi:hypothetical protein